MFRLAFIWLLVNYSIDFSLPMHLSFCDGSRFVTVDYAECPAGINFGTRKPHCVCISGIYRLWMNNCLAYDGFMDQGCATLQDDALEVVGMKLTGKVKNFANSSLAIFTTITNGTKEEGGWTAYPLGDKGYSTSDNFYTVHGQAYIFTWNAAGKEKRMSICVEKKYKTKNEVCRYYRDEDKIWSTRKKKIKIVVKDVCEGPFGSKKTLMKPHSCYPIMRKRDSECSLSCNQSSTSIKDIDIIEEMNMQEGNITNALRRRAKPSMSEEDIEKEITGLGKTIKIDNPVLINNQEGLFPSINATNITGVTINQQIDEYNFFLNRRLNHYSKLRQVGFLQPNDLRQIPPRRTFELLDIVKDIGKKTCPEQYVSGLFIDQAIDLFVILHKGRNYRYWEDLGRQEYQWIKTILTSCLVDTKELLMKREESDSSDKCTEFQKVNGVCFGSDSNCTSLTIHDSHHILGKYHFVVEATWDLIDLAQVVCFPSFTQSYRMFHQWEQSSEKLFTREIRKFWHNPNVSLKVYQNLLTPSAIVDMHNLEMCVEAVYASNPSFRRLIRPPSPRKFFKRRKRETTTSQQDYSKVDVYCRKTESQFSYPSC